MHMRRVAYQLADLFARHGHATEAGATVTGRTRTSYRIPLVLRTPSGLVLVDGDLESPTVDDGTVLRLYLMAVDCGAHGLFLHAGAVPPSAYDHCGDRVTLWPREQAIRLLGETLWNEALGIPPPPLPLPTAPAPAPLSTKPDVAGAPALPEAPAPATPIDSVEVAAAPFIDLEAPASSSPAVDLETGVDVVVTTLPTTVADEMATAEPLVAATPAPPVELPPAFQPLPEAPAEPAPAPAAAAEATGAATPEPALFQLPPAFQPPAAPLDAPLPVPDGSRGLLPCRITLDEARQAVADRLFGIEEWELILQPVHLFDCAVEVLRSGSLQADTQRSLLQVHGTDRKVTPVEARALDPPSRVFASPDLTVMDKVLRVSPERALQLAQEWATAAHGKTVNVNLAGVDDGFDLVEKRLIGPTSGQVHLTPLGIWHRPFWRLWGNNGHVDLDAVEATVIDADLKAADPDFVMVD